MGPVDGYDAPTRTCFEFYGCYFHGCARCYRDTDQNTCLDRPMEELRRKTHVKEGCLRACGCTVITLCECEWRDRQDHDVELQTTTKQQLDLVTPLVVRGAFYGGRTGCTKLWARVSETSEETCSHTVNALTYMDFK